MAEEQALVQLMDTLDGLELTKSEYEWLEQRFAAMTEKEQFLFRGAMKLEKPETASGAISIASQLHCYELFYSAGDEDALGQFVMKHLEQVPDVARPYLSPAYVGQMFQQEGASGVFCEGHYIRRSAAPEHQPDKNLSELPTTGEYAIRIKLASRSNMEGVWIGFPDAGEYTDPNYPDELLLGLDAMQAESLSECIALEVDRCLPQLMDILSQYDSASELVRHAIDFGHVWAEQGQGEAYWMDKWQAVLELEDCHRLDQALDFSQNLQHFAFIPRGVELGRFGFELAVKSQVIDRNSFLAKCFDGKSYAEWYIQKHGLSATDHGYVAWNGGELHYEYSDLGGSPMTAQTM